MLDRSCRICICWEDTGQVVCGLHRPDLDPTVQAPLSAGPTSPKASDLRARRAVLYAAQSMQAQFEAIGLTCGNVVSGDTWAVVVATGRPDSVESALRTYMASEDKANDGDSTAPTDRA